MSETSRKLPNPKWLVRHGYAQLARMMLAYPEAFAHIPQDHLRKPQRRCTLAEHVADAEKLVNDHGSLPPCHWLYKKGYGGLYQAMQDNPDAFAHIPKPDRSQRANNRLFQPQVSKWVSIAEGLAKEHGCVPGCNWLKDNGYWGLYIAWQRHPEQFNHIARNRKTCRQLDEWVRIAEQLVKEHGRVPRWKWLMENNYRGLTLALAHHPQLFAHLKP